MSTRGNSHVCAFCLPLLCRVVRRVPDQSVAPVTGVYHGAGLRLMHGQRDADRVRSELDVAQERDVGRLVMISPQDGYVGAVASSESLSDVEILREGDPRWII